MFRRTLFAGLVVLVSAMSVRADVHRNDEHQFEADFPGKPEQLTKPIEEGGKIIVVHAKDDARLYMIGAAVEAAEELTADQNSEYSKSLIEGLMNTRKSASIVKEEELKLNDNTPKGNSYVIKHDQGWIFVWAAIENNKGYFVLIEGTTEESLKAEAVKKFQQSVKIKGVK